MKCLKCHHPDSDCWKKQHCELVPDFGIDTNGQLENLYCSFLDFLSRLEIPPPTGSEMLIVNDYRLFPSEMAYAISICENTDYAKTNLVNRVKTRLDAIAKAISSL